MARFQFRRNRNALRPINRIKHVVDVQTGIVANTLNNQDLVKATDTPVLAASNEVETGSTVNGIYLRVECYATTGAALANVYMMVWKNPGGNIADFNPNQVGVNDNKRFVIHQEMVMIEQSVNGNPRTLFNGVIAIPKGYRRFAPNDELTVSFLAPGVNISLCLQCHYKEFR